MSGLRGWGGDGFNSRGYIKGYYESSCMHNKLIITAVQEPVQEYLDLSASSMLTLFPFNHTICKFRNFPKSLTSSRPLNTGTRKKVTLVLVLKLRNNRAQLLKAKLS